MLSVLLSPLYRLTHFLKVFNKKIITTKKHTTRKQKRSVTSKNKKPKELINASHFSTTKINIVCVCSKKLTTTLGRKSLSKSVYAKTNTQEKKGISNTLKTIPAILSCPQHPATSKHKINCCKDTFI